jgi:NADPH-dependent curcumin reductase CurA
MSVRFSNMVPDLYKKVVIKELTRDFAKATQVVTVQAPASLKPTEVLVRNIYAGVNASDINYSAGVYRPGAKLPFDAGFEGLGRVVGVGSAVSEVDLEDIVVTQCYGTFSEFQVVPSRSTRRVPKADPKYLALEVSGVTASIALAKVLEPQRGEVALVTAAAGGTGQFAAQLLKKKYGCHVIGTCSSHGKSAFLKSIGVDRVVNYTEEDLDQVLAGYRGGVNVVYESVGGNMFDLAVKHLANKGRLGVIGNVSGYQSGSSFGEKQANGDVAKEDGTGSATRAGYRPGAPIGTQLLSKSASVRGFFLPHFPKYVPEHFHELCEMVDNGTLISQVDPALFRGVASAAKAVEYLLSGKSCGKVVLTL